MPHAPEFQACRLGVVNGQVPYIIRGVRYPVFTSLLQNGHRLGCDVVVLVVLLGHLAFGLTFYQLHSDMILDRVELLGRDI